jgi:hypothetical protein
MPNRVVLQDELRGDRCPEAEREGRRSIQLIIAERADSFRRLATVLAQEIKCNDLRDFGVLTSVVGIQLGDDLPRDIGHRLPAGDRARKIDLDGVDEGDVVHDLAHRPAVSGRGRSLPFGPS